MCVSSEPITLHEFTMDQCLPNTAVSSLLFFVHPFKWLEHRKRMAESQATLTIAQQEQKMHETALSLTAEIEAMKVECKRLKNSKHIVAANAKFQAIKRKEAQLQMTIGGNQKLGAISNGIETTGFAKKINDAVGAAAATFTPEQTKRALNEADLARDVAEESASEANALSQIVSKPLAQMASTGYGEVYDMNDASIMAEIDAWGEEDANDGASQTLTTGWQKMEAIPSTSPVYSKTDGVYSNSALERDQNVQRAKAKNLDAPMSTTERGTRVAAVLSAS